MGRLPFVYRPPDGMPAVLPAPAERNAYVTFGYFGRTERLNEEVIAAWSRILHAVPGSKLMLNTRALQEVEFRGLIEARFADCGIDPQRLVLVFTQPQARTWDAYGDIDIALDPFPHNAGTTTIEALWLGVPVLTLAGRPSVGTLGAGILSAVGLADWVTSDVDIYVARAVAAAGDPAALARLRQTLRARVQASPLCDAAGLARLTEQAYRALWDRWNGGDAERLRGFFASGQTDDATRVARRMLSRDSDPATAEHVLALLAHAAGREDEAAAAIGRAIQHCPDDPEMRANQAAILRVRGDLAAAETAARIALRLQPDSVQALNNLGNILRDAGRWPESVAAYQQALQLAPGFGDAWANLAWVLSLTGEAHAAEHAARRGIEADPKNANAFNNLGLALMRQSRLVEAEAALRNALALRPDFAQAHSNILFCLNYRSDLDAETIATEYRSWDRVHAAPLAPTARHYSVDRDPDRRLRIGYVSPDFRHHAVSFFAEPLLRAHDRRAVEVCCYAEVAVPDATTERFRALADNWVSTVGMRDADVADRIADDRIDVLVDLAGHTAGNRLLAFARRPAPVMLATMLGSGTTSGLSAMTGFIADAELAPPGSEALFSERVIRLGRVPLVYAPPAAMPDVADLPARRDGRVTFGYFGRTVRLNARVLRAWSLILNAVPGSRLMLNSAPYAEEAGREQIAARFAELGIARDRLALVHTAPQPRTWEAYGEIDIALDPFPHNAGTTTVEALWQGVPVVTLKARPGVGRIGASLLRAVGLDDFVAADETDYVARAIRAAGDIAALARLRATLRDRVATSPLCDAAGLAREMEAVYRAVWRNWCATG
ncbi:MAG: tetratricopeptide repeat protein [Alphaproteobacteria bacterium]|nr:tetratricopeptide repeat protein [Alphaproteobacteria bacterium]